MTDTKFQTKKEFIDHFHQEWKQRCISDNKPNAGDNFTYHFFKSFNKAGEFNVELFKRKLIKAFAPVTNAKKLANGAIPYLAFDRASNALHYELACFIRYTRTSAEHTGWMFRGWESNGKYKEFFALLSDEELAFFIRLLAQAHPNDK